MYNTAVSGATSGTWKNNKNVIRTNTHLNKQISLEYVSLDMSASHCTKYWLAGKKVGWLAAQLPLVEEMTGCQNDQLAELAGSGCNKFRVFSKVLFAILHILQHAWHGCNFFVESGGGGVILVLRHFFGTCFPKKQHVKRSQLRIIKLGSKRGGGGGKTQFVPQG